MVERNLEVDDEGWQHRYDNGLVEGAKKDGYKHGKEHRERLTVLSAEVKPKEFRGAN